jgi:hypothetical protein
MCTATQLGGIRTPNVTSASITHRWSDILHLSQDGNPVNQFYLSTAGWIVGVFLTTLSTMLSSEIERVLSDQQHFTKWFYPLDYLDPLPYVKTGTMLELYYLVRVDRCYICHYYPQVPHSLLLCSMLLCTWPRKNKRALTLNLLTSKRSKDISDADNHKQSQTTVPLLRFKQLVTFVFYNPAIV